MNMNRRMLMLGFIAGTSLLAGCGSRVALTPPSSVKGKTMTEHFAAVNSVYISGNANVTLKQSRTKATFVSFDKNKRYDFDVHVRHHALYVLVNSYRGLPVTVQINQLHKLTVYGNTSINAKNIHAKNLTIESYTNGQVNLNGVMNVQNVTASRNGTLNLSWVNSPNLTIHLKDHAILKLSGVAKQVYAKVEDNANLNARYLRAHSMHVRTRNTASASVGATHDLYAYAGGSSNIYYYQPPKHLTRYSTEAANILQMQ